MSTIVTIPREDEAPVQSYVQNRAPELHPAWILSGSAVLDPDTGQYVQDVQACTEHFKKVMEIYTNRSTDPEVRRFRIEACHSWEDVQEAAAKAVDAYKSKDKGFKGFFRKAGRSMGMFDPTNQGWIQALPSGDYGSILCGGLKLIFGAAARMSAVRKQILDALDCLPNTVEEHDSYLSLYKDDTKLVRKASDLYIALLVAIEGMLDWLDHKAYKEVGKALFTQDLYGQRIEAKIINIQKKSMDFKAQVQICLHQHTAQTNQLARVNHVQNALIFTSVQTVEEATKEHTTTLNMIQDSTKDNTEALNSLTALLDAGLRDRVHAALWIKQLTEQHERQAKKLLEKFERQQKAIEQLTTFAAQLTTPPGAQIQPAPITSISHLSSLLSPSHAMTTPDEDISHAHRTGRRLARTSHSRIDHLMRSAAFNIFFQLPHSDVLCVDGMEPSPESAVSSMSYFTSMLISELSKQPHVIVVSYFCGLHIDEHSDTVSLMCSLTTQLLASPYVQSRLNLSPIRAEDLHGLQLKSIAYICALCRFIIISLSSDVAIFVLIDSISCYENAARCDNLKYATQKLFDIAIECGSRGSGGSDGPLFKLFMTSQKASRFAKHVFPKEKHLVLPNETMRHVQSLGFR